MGKLHWPVPRTGGTAGFEPWERGHGGSLLDHRSSSHMKDASRKKGVEKAMWHHPKSAVDAQPDELEQQHFRECSNICM